MRTLYLSTYKQQSHLTCALNPEDSPNSEDPFVEAFLDACYDGEPSKVQEALATGRLTPEDLDQGLSLATSRVHTDIVSTLFQAGASVSISAVGSLPADMKQHPSIVRLFCVTTAGNFYHCRRASGDWRICPL